MHDIRCKYVKTDKRPPPTKKQERIELVAEARKKLLQGVKKNALILFADEVVFTSKTLPRKTFACKG